MCEKRAVAFLDILGFKHLLSTESTSTVASKYTKVIELIDESNRLNLSTKHSPPSLFDHPLDSKGWCIMQIFSDSIILVSHENTEESCLRLLVYVWRIMQGCLSAEMPFRGGISYDEMFVDESKGIFLGRALTKAYELEGSQDWIGVAINDELEEHFPVIFRHNRGSFLDSIFLKYPVPFKGGGRKEMRTVNWRFNFIVENGTRSLMPRSIDKAVITKVENTLNYAKSVRDSGKVCFLDPDLIPPELMRFYCSKKEPPIEHGDDL